MPWMVLLLSVLSPSISLHLTWAIWILNIFSLPAQNICYFIHDLDMHVWHTITKIANKKWNVIINDILRWKIGLTHKYITIICINVLNSLSKWQSILIWIALNMHRMCWSNLWLNRYTIIFFCHLSWKSSKGIISKEKNVTIDL